MCMSFVLGGVSFCVDLFNAPSLDLECTTFVIRRRSLSLGVLVHRSNARLPENDQLDKEAIKTELQRSDKWLKMLASWKSGKGDPPKVRCMCPAILQSPRVHV